MGLHLSTAAAINPLSLASTLIGFISFALTLTNWLNLFWSSLLTLFQAESEIHAYLSRLRIELWEEKASLRRLRKHNKDFSRTQHGNVREQLRIDDVTLRNMQDVVKRLTTRFKNLERPFLQLDTRVIRTRPRIDDTYTRESGWEDEYKQPTQSIQEQHDDDDDCDFDDLWSGNHYCNVTLAKRLAWLKRRPEAVKLTESLVRVQTRRIARQVGEISLTLYAHSITVEQVRDDLESINSSMSRIVGIRRVE